MDDRNDYWGRVARRRFSRRSALRGAGVAGFGLAGAALIGCGSDDDDPDPTGTPGGGGATSTGTPDGTSASATTTPEGVQRGGTLRLSLLNDPPTIDPFGNTSVSTKEFAAHAYSRLYKLGTGPDITGGEAAPVPDLAESAETDDGQHWVVRLRPGAKFHNVEPVNGREVDAEDVLLTWQDFRDPTNVNRESFAFVTDVQAVDATTVSFTLDAPSAVFLDTIADGNLLYILPKESDGGFNLAEKAIGSGPWILDRYDISQIMVWKANPDFYGDVPLVDGLEESIIPEYANRLAQFQAGNVHALGINANDVLDLRSQREDVQWRGEVSALTSIFYFNNISDPNQPWSDERIRQAVSMAIDRDALMDLAYNIKALQEAGLEVSTAWNNLIPVGHTRWWLDPQSEAQGPSAQYFVYNAEEAAKLLDSASPGGLDLKYQYTDNRYGQTFNSVAEANIGYLTEVGFRPQTEVQDYNSVYITQTSSGFFEGLAFGYETPFAEAGTYADRPFGVVDGEAIEKNRTRVVDQEILDLSRRQSRELDVDARRELLHEVQRINALHMYYIPNQAGAGTGWSAYQPEVRGIRSTRGYGDGVETRPYLWFAT